MQPDSLIRARAVARVLADEAGAPTPLDPDDDRLMAALAGAIEVVQRPDPVAFALARRDPDSFITERDAALLLGGIEARTLVKHGLLPDPIRLDGWHKLHRLGDVIEARNRLARDFRSNDARSDRVAHAKAGGKARHAKR